MSLSPPIEFRSTRLGATVAVLQAVAPPALADALHKMLGGRPDFFNGEALVLDFSALPELPAQIDWAGLNSLMRRFRLQPIGVIALPEAHHEAARRIGLAVLDEALEAMPTSPPPPQESPVVAESAATAVTTTATASTAETVAGPANGLETLFVDRMLRSGQQIYARDANLVVVGGVNAGAEIIADGSIHCYGPMYGRAIAGAQGAATARILATHFGAELISIAGVFRTFESGIPAEFAARAVQVRLQGNEDSLKLEALSLD